MKTFETMKHNIPEGATHYYHSCSGYGWVKKEPCATGRDKSFIWDGGKWVRGVVVSYVVKPIPKIPTETPEEKGALDAIKQVEWDGEGLPPVGVECEIYCPVNPVSPDGDKHWAKTEIVAIIDCGFGANTTVVYKTGWSGDWYVDAHPSDLLRFRKPETPEANKAREAVENLHDASQQAESLALRETLAHETLDKSVDEQLKTYRYEKVEASEAVYWFTKTNDALFAEPDSSQQYDDLQHYIYNLDECGSSSLYRRIEVTERNEFIEKSCEIIRTSAKEDILIIGKMFDAGCRFVNGKG